MAKQVPAEVAHILKTIPIEVLRGLAKVHDDKDAGTALRSMLNFITLMDQQHIMKGSGAVSSLDTMINSTVDQTFYRGRISLSVLLNTLVTNAPEFLDKRVEDKKKEVTPYGKAR